MGVWVEGHHLYGLIILCGYLLLYHWRYYRYGIGIIENREKEIGNLF